MDGWADGWKEGWVEGWMGGWMGWWVDGWKDGLVGWWVDGWILAYCFIKIIVALSLNSEMLQTKNNVWLNSLNNFNIHKTKLKFDSNVKHNTMQLPQKFEKKNHQSKTQQV